MYFGASININRYHNGILELLLSKPVSSFLRNRRTRAPIQLVQLRHLLFQLTQTEIRFLRNHIPKFNRAYVQYSQLPGNDIDDFIYFLYLQYD